MVAQRSPVVKATINPRSVSFFMAICIDKNLAFFSREVNPTLFLSKRLRPFD